MHAPAKHYSQAIRRSSSSHPTSQLLLVLLLTATAGVFAPARAQQARPASLLISVADPTGAVIVGATVEVERDDRRPAAIVTDGRGQANLESLVAGSWSVRVSSPGFEDFVDPTLMLRPGRNRLSVTLQIAGFAEQVMVARDPQEAAVDPGGDSMTILLTAEELDALPDDEEELEQLLLELAGPGAEIEVDGFLDGPLPSRAQIQEVRIRRNIFSAETHRRASSRVQVITRPGTDQWRSSVNFGFRDETMNARNAFATTSTPEQQKRLTMMFQGPIVRDRTSVALRIDGLSSYDSRPIVAVTPNGPVEGVVRRPQSRANVSAGVQHTLSPTHSARIEYQHRDTEQENLGVGDYDLPERAYTRTNTRQLVRLGSSGTIGNRVFNELRLQVLRQDWTSTPEIEAPAIRVLDSLTAGGAGIQGARSARVVQLREKADVRWRNHAFSAGGLFEWSDYQTDEIRNRHGTFTFSSLADFAAGQPVTFTQRRGDPSVRYSMFQGAWFIQDDIRLHRNLNLGIGLRHEWQSHIDSRWNLAPRVGLAWAPARDGRTTIRTGAGLFHDWYQASTYEETLQVDGRRVEEVTIRFPAYPDPFLKGDFVLLPRGRIQQADHLDMPRIRQGMFAVERRLGEGMRVNTSYTFRDGVNLLRGRNVNAPGPDGERPDPAVGNVIEIRSIGRAREHELTTQVSGRLPWRRLFVTARYTLGYGRDDGDGPLSLPADNLAPDEWGPARDDVRHRFSAFGNVELLNDVRLGVNLRAESARPYNITTGRDDNADTVLNDRPAGVGRNAERGEGAFRMDLRLSWRIGAGAPGRIDAQEAGGRRGRARDWRSEHRVMTELYVRAMNVLNSVNRTGFSGVMTSPFFGLPSSAQPARRVEIGTRIMF
jgi:hypothetical protein